MGVTKSKFERYRILFNITDEFKDLLGCNKLTMGARNSEKILSAASPSPKIHENHVKNLEEDSHVKEAQSWLDLKKRIQMQNKRYLSEIENLFNQFSGFQSNNEAQGFIRLITTLLTDYDKQEN
jgi:hypothetical protein